ncbi:MAG: extracellular solute-binding protein [Betaproteobacteria bacterium]
MKRIKVIFGISILMAAFGASAQTLVGVAALAEQAKKEGSVTIFTGTARYPQSSIVKLEQAFLSKYGYPIKITIASTGPHPTVIQQLRSEASSGVKPAIDLLPSALSLIKILGDANALEPVDWESLGAPSQSTVKGQYAVMTNVIARNIVYNTNLVKKNDAPKRLEDLLDPKWQGKIVAPAIGDAFAMMVPILGEEKTTALVKNLVKDQKIVLVQSITDVATKVASGEFAVGFGVPADWTGTRSKGAPIDNAPPQKVSGQPFYAVVLKNSAHPAAAKMMGIFICCTVEGQKALQDSLGWSRFETIGTEANEIGGAGRGVYPDISFQLDQQRRISTELGKLLGQ